MLLPKDTGEIKDRWNDKTRSLVVTPVLQGMYGTRDRLDSWSITSGLLSLGEREIYLTFYQ